MNKNILKIGALFLFLITGCGGNSNTPTSNSTISGNNENKLPDEIICTDNKYRVQVVKPDGYLLTSKFNVQWCSDTNCYPKQAVDGVATNDLADGNYLIHLINIPDEYTYKPGYTATADNKCMTINLSSVLNPTENEKNDASGNPINSGTINNPYIVSEGIYKANISDPDESIYYGFNPTKAGTYIIESWSDDIWLNNEGPLISYYGNGNIDVNNPVLSDDNSGFDKNFKLQIEISASDISSNNISYVFGISASVIPGLSKKIAFSITNAND